MNLALVDSSGAPSGTGPGTGMLIGTSKKGLEGATPKEGYGAGTGPLSLESLEGRGADNSGCGKLLWGDGAGVWRILGG